jgi:hypothetical protein
MSPRPSRVALLPLEDLSQMGFIRNGIVELILSTFNDANRPHAAPMGAYTEDLHRVILKPFKSSQTYGNLKRRRSAVANITSDPQIFYRATFKDMDKDGLPEAWFTRAETVDAPRLTNIDACVELSVTEIEETEDRAKMTCRVEKMVTFERLLPKAYNRAASAVIESLIHATRIKVYLNSGEYSTAEELIRLVERYHRIVERVAPGSALSTMMENIQGRIVSWRKIQ